MSASEFLEELMANLLLNTLQVTQIQVTLSLSELATADSGINLAAAMIKLECKKDNF